MRPESVRSVKEGSWAEAAVVSEAYTSLHVWDGRREAAWELGGSC